MVTTGISKHKQKSEAQLQGGPEVSHTCLKLPDQKDGVTPLGALQLARESWMDWGSVSQEVWLLLVSVVHTFLLLSGIPLQESNYFLLSDS